MPSENLLIKWRRSRSLRIQCVNHVSALTLTIDFACKSMPSGVPKEISLCLFRILQEALQNAVKYSGVRHFRVKVQGTPTDIRLTISDDGVGFDQHHALSGSGLGLISRRERVQFVRGELSMVSELSRGTTVYVRVPFTPEKRHASLAG